MVNQLNGGSADYAESNGEVVNVTLTGTAAVTIVEQSWGAFQIAVTGPRAGDPLLCCSVSKRGPTSAVVIGNVVADPADDGCQLGIDWPNDRSLQLAKSIASHNGTYSVSLH